MVNVGVAVAAPCPHISEGRLGVTLRATDVLVHAKQGIGSLAVIKLRNGANGFPSENSVTVLAGDVEIAVRAARDGCGTSLRNRRRCSGNPSNEQHAGEHQPDGPLSTKLHVATSPSGEEAICVPIDEGPGC